MFRKALLALFILASLAAHGDEVLSAADREAILAIAGDGDAAWNARDAAGLAATFTADGRNTILNTPVDLRGREAIVAYFKSSLAKVDPALRHRTVVDELTPVAPGVVVAAARVWLDRVDANGAATAVKKFTITSVIVREGDAWRIRVNRVHPEVLSGATGS